MDDPMEVKVTVIVAALDGSWQKTMEVPRSTVPIITAEWDDPPAGDMATRSPFLRELRITMRPLRSPNSDSLFTLTDNR